MNCLFVVLVCVAALVFTQTEGEHEGLRMLPGYGPRGKQLEERGSNCPNRYDKIWATEKYKYCNYDQVLSDMFYTHQEIFDKSFKREVAEIIKKTDVDQITDPNYLPQRQLQDYLSRKSQHQRASGSSCCETSWSCVVPETVKYNGKNHSVYQPDAGYQLVFEGQCGAGATCPHGTCTEEDNYYTWIIIIAEGIGYDPPLKFVPVTFNNFCYCATV